MATDEVIAVDLTEQERRMLLQGTGEWGGPAYPNVDSNESSGCEACFEGTSELRAAELRHCGR